MKLKKRHIGLGFLGLLLIGFSTQLCSNFWGLIIGNGYVIPNQNAIFTFKAIKMNKGSGDDYWLYGEDQKYHYTTLEKDDITPYALILKEKAKSIPNFDKTNYKTWWNKQVSCEDILSNYAKKPNGLEFIKCERLKDSQTVIKVTYRVSGKQSKEIEDFLVENYGMGKLKWTCCGWDIAGKYGQFEHSEFKKIDTYCSAIISMYASGEVGNENGQTGIKLETDRDKIDYFTVIVELVIV